MHGRRLPQDIVAAGAFDPSIGVSMVESAQTNYTSAQYPTPDMVRADGRTCGCRAWFEDVCRMEFRRVRDPRLVLTCRCEGRDAYGRWRVK